MSGLGSVLPSLDERARILPELRKNLLHFRHVLIETVKTSSWRLFVVVDVLDMVCACVENISHALDESCCLCLCLVVELVEDFKRMLREISILKRLLMRF